MFANTARGAAGRQKTVNAELTGGTREGAQNRSHSKMIREVAFVKTSVESAVVIDNSIVTLMMC